jgi:hypothetical protein
MTGSVSSNGSGEKTNENVKNLQPALDIGSHINAQGSAAGAELPLTWDWATEPKTTTVPPSACNPLLGARADGRCRGNLGQLLFQPLLSVPQVIRLLHV